MRIDLHTHSWVSDGTQAPAELVASAAAADLDIVALTDHDQSAGWDEARAAAAAHGIGWLGGIEVTCRVPFTGISVHMLAYGVSRGNEELRAALAGLRDSRDGRARAMVDRLAEDFPIDWASVQEQTQAGSTIGRPHIADALVAAGVVADRTEAFAHILSPRGPYYVGQPALDPVQAVRLIHAAGGAAVMAHPVAGARGRVIGRDEMLAVVDAGLDGVEVYHRDNSAEGRRELLALASERGLIVTGSSDYHGAGKPNLLGENTTEPRALLRLLERTEAPEIEGFDASELR
ncbi:MAG: PHP domain-containing protein [Arthrobacter sp.]|jgi:predicted metal-dependent phosphoesterase TrpH|nr:PHP domain-containing protein [Arthrobacter sp.]